MIVVNNYATKRNLSRYKKLKESQHEPVTALIAIRMVLSIHIKIIFVFFFSATADEG